MNAAAAAATILRRLQRRQRWRSHIHRLRPRQPGAPNLAQPGSASDPTMAQIQIGQVGQPGNPPQLGNPGWDPLGLSDTTHSWWNIEGGAVTMNESGNALTIVWGSPNDNNPAATNTVSFYTGADGTGNLIGQVLASDIYTQYFAASTIRRTPVISSPSCRIRSSAALCSRPVRATSNSPSRAEFPSRRPGPCWALGFAGLALGWIQALATGSSRPRARLIHPRIPAGTGRPGVWAACSLARRAKALARIRGGGAA